MESAFLCLHIQSFMPRSKSSSLPAVVFLIFTNLAFLADERAYLSRLWNTLGRASHEMTVQFGFRDATYALVAAYPRARSSSMKPQARKASHCANMFDRVISIQNPAFRSQNLSDNTTDEKNRSPAHSTACIYAFWETVGGQIAALKS